MTTDRMELLRIEWQERFDRAIAELAGPVEALQAALGLESEKERILRAADEIERARIVAGLEDPGPRRKRKDPLWAHRKRFGR